MPISVKAKKICKTQCILPRFNLPLVNPVQMVFYILSTVHMRRRLFKSKNYKKSLFFKLISRSKNKEEDELHSIQAHYKIVLVALDMAEKIQ